MRRVVREKSYFQAVFSLAPGINTCLLFFVIFLHLNIYIHINITSYRNVCWRSSKYILSGSKFSVLSNDIFRKRIRFTTVQYIDVLYVRHMGEQYSSFHFNVLFIRLFYMLAKEISRKGKIYETDYFDCIHCIISPLYLARFIEKDND